MNAKYHSVRALFVASALVVAAANSGCGSAPETEQTGKSQSEPVTASKNAAPTPEPSDVYSAFPVPIRFPSPAPAPTPIACIIHPGEIGEYAIKPFTNCVGDECCPPSSSPIHATD